MRFRKIEMATQRFAINIKGYTLMKHFQPRAQSFPPPPNPPQLRIPLTLQHHILIPQHLQIRFNKPNLLVYNLVHLVLQPTRNIPKLFLAVTPVVVEEGRGAEFACDEVLAAAVTAGT